MLLPVPVVPDFETMSSLRCIGKDRQVVVTSYVSLGLLLKRQELAQFKSASILILYGRRLDLELPDFSHLSISKEGDAW